jgi:hypothetical protein
MIVRARPKSIESVRRGKKGALRLESKKVSSEQ